MWSRRTGVVSSGALLCLGVLLVLLGVGRAVEGQIASPFAPRALQAAPKQEQGELEVFIIAHSHCDPGWLMSYESYYRTRVKSILDSVLVHLRDGDRKFNWSESSFLQRWYTDATESQRQEFKRYLEQGKIEIVGGGWVQNDEASPTAEQVIHQMTVGHEFLRKSFGEASVPRIAWQIDPFGHSDLTPQLMHLMGFEGLVINRIHYSIKQQLKASKQMEFFWTWDDAKRFEEGILTHVLHTHYSAPQGFDWEERGITITTSNVEARCNQFARMMRERAAAYQTGKLLVPFGDDFKFHNAKVQFENMDRVIDFINDHSDLYPGLKIRYATVGEYFDAINPPQSKVLFPVFRGDFFPYADNGDSYWTGYYSTRPALKRHSRQTNALVRSGDMAFALARSNYCGAGDTGEKAVTCRLAEWDEIYGELLYAREQGGLMMHHDAITGTAKDYVVDDYEERMSTAMRQSSQALGDMFELLLYGEAIPDNSWEPHGKTDAYDLAPGEGIPLQLVSSLSWERTELVEIFTRFEDVSVLGPDGREVPTQVMPYAGFESLEDPQGVFRVMFRANLPPIGVATYFLSRTAGIATTRARLEEVTTNDLVLENARLKVTLGPNSGMVESIENKETGTKVLLEHSLFKYTTRNSGAYIMRTVASKLGEEIYAGSAGHVVKVARGQLADEVTVLFTSDNKIRMVLDHEGDFAGVLRVEYMVTAGGDEEIVARYETDLETEHSFFTDNGLHTQLRFFEDKHRTEQRYYPTHHFAFLREAYSARQFTVFTAQAVGVSSGVDGQVETMIHRHLTRDDGRGLGQGVRDKSWAEHRQLLMAGTMDSSNAAKQGLRFRLDDPVHVLACSSRVSPSQWLDTHPAWFTALAQPLPEYLHVLTLQAREEGSDDVVVRLMDLRREDSDRSAETHPMVQLHSCLGDSFTPQFTREVSLSLLHTPETFPDVPCNLDRDKIFSVSIDDSIPITDRQNTDEAGVFISMAARKPLSVATAIDGDLSMEAYNINTFLTVLGGDGPLRLSGQLGVVPEVHGHVGHHPEWNFDDADAVTLPLEVQVLEQTEEAEQEAGNEAAGEKEHTANKAGGALTRLVEPHFVHEEYPRGELKFSILLPVAGIGSFIALYLYSGRKRQRLGRRGGSRAQSFV